MKKEKKFIQSRDFEDNISKLSQEEVGKRQFYRPIYSLHKWWARRPGALFRSILLMVAKDNPNIFINRSNGDISDNSDYFQSHNFKNFTIFDPFMGGGTTLIEANRLGFNVIGSDLNPVSFWIVREELKSINLNKLDQYFKLLQEGAGEKIRKLYKTTCPRCNSDCDSIYVFWLRYATCPNCSSNVPLYKRTTLNEGLSRTSPLSKNNPATVFCPNCYSLSDWDGVASQICNNCNYTFNPDSGTYNNGFFDCPNCHETHISLIKSLKDHKKLFEKILAIEYYCEKCKSRIYKKPDNQDLEKIKELSTEFKENFDNLIFPRQKILPGDSSHRWLNHNYVYYHEVFNPRQIIAFNYLIEEILKIPDVEYQNAFFTIFSNSLEYNNMMTPYNYPHRKLHHLFNYHAMPLTTTPVENSVWGASDHGAGTFVNCYKRYYNAKEYCIKPFDKFKSKTGEIKTIYSENEKIYANFVDTFDVLLKTDHGALLLCEDSSNVNQIPDKSIDFVITDPPYFDNIHYSELSNFFYVWLSCLKKHKCFENDHVPSEREAIVNDGMKKTDEGYTQLLTSVFTECNRVLKNNGKLVFTFHHTKWKAWWTILTAVADSGFVISDFFPIQSEYKVNPHVRNKESLDMDLVIICQKREQKQSRKKEDFMEIMHSIDKKGLFNNNDTSSTKLFLYYMGSLLQSACLSWNDKKITYSWFEDNLLKISNLLKNESLQKSDPVNLKNTIQKELLDFDR